MPVTTYGDISPRTAAFAKKRLLIRGQHLMVTERFGQVDPQQQNKSKTAKWRRYNSLARATAPLAEGVPPTGQQLTYTDVQATLEQYGDTVKLTDVIKDTHEDPVFQETFDLCGEQAAETIEVVRIAFLKAGTNVFYGSGVASRTLVNAAPTRGDLRKIYRYFKRHKAMEISKIIRASHKISTEPVASAYFAMGHTDLDADIRGMANFVPAEQYSDSTRMIEGEIGKVDQFRFVLTALFEPWETSGASGTTFLSGGAEVSSAASCDVYPLIIVARNAYAIVPLQGYNSVTPIVVNPKPSSSDPLGQIGWAGWKTWQAGAILNQTWVARLEVAATASPT